MGPGEKTSFGNNDVLVNVYLFHSPRPDHDTFVALWPRFGSGRNVSIAMSPSRLWPGSALGSVEVAGDLCGGGVVARDGGPLGAVWRRPGAELDDRGPGRGSCESSPQGEGGYLLWGPGNWLQSVRPSRSLFGLLGCLSVGRRPLRTSGRPAGKSSDG